MARSWWLACQAWIVSGGAFVFALVGVMVTHLMSTPTMAAVVAVPPALVLVFAGYEWWTARGYGNVLARLHLLGIAVGLVTWLLYQTAPGDLSFDPSPAALCDYAGRPPVGECLARAGLARTHAHLAWWSTGVLILLLVPFARRSRTAAWGTAAIGFAGGGFALHFFELFVRSYGH